MITSERWVEWERLFVLKYVTHYFSPLEAMTFSAMKFQLLLFFINNNLKELKYP